MASDAAYNGRFVTGVLSTGIFCLPSCRARKPKRENVRFFANFDEARSAGLRACLKCRPEAFESGEYDPMLRPLEEAVRRVRSHPGEFPTIASLATALGVGETKLYALLRTHFHTTPAGLLAEARIEWVGSQLPDSASTVAELAYAAGFETLSSFYDHFRSRTALTPTEFRELDRQTAFRLDVTPAASAGLKHLLGRNPMSNTERLVGNDAAIALRLLGEPTTVFLTFQPEGVEVRVEDARFARPAHRTVTRMLGLGQDVEAFEAFAYRTGHGRLVEGRSGLRIPQTATVFDGLVWAIVGQQVGLGFAYALRARLAERLNPALPSGLHPLPTAEEVAQLTVDDLRPLQFSTRKAEYLIDLARNVPDLDGISATRAAATLQSLRGFGPWATNYVRMRALGFVDCVPLGDTGILAGLRRYHQRPDITQGDVDGLMQPFSPYRSLACFHLWQSLKDPE